MKEFFNKAVEWAEGVLRISEWVQYGRWIAIGVGVVLGLVVLLLLKALF